MFQVKFIHQHFILGNIYVLESNIVVVARLSKKTLFGAWGECNIVLRGYLYNL